MNDVFFEYLDEFVSAYIDDILVLSDQRFYQPEVTWPNRDSVGHVTHAPYI
jgi:hypothetical protein